VSSLHRCGPLAYSDNECAKQLLDALDDSVWGMKITALEESDDFIILDTEKLFSKLKSHEFCKERRRYPTGCFECGDTTHFIADCPKMKKFNSSNKYNNNNRNDSSDKGEGKKKYPFGDKKKKFQKMMSRACAALSDHDFSIDDSSSSEEDKRPKRKISDFTGLCLMGKAS
jgi:hypothetical protein